MTSLEVWVIIISKQPGLVVNTLFNRRYRKRKDRRHRQRLNLKDLTSSLENCLHIIVISLVFLFNIRSLVFSLPVKWMGVLWNVFQCWRQTHDVPDRIACCFFIHTDGSREWSNPSLGSYSYSPWQQSVGESPELEYFPYNHYDDMWKLICCGQV